MRLKKSILALTLTTALLATSCAAQKKAVESHTEAQSSAQLHTQETTLLDAATAAMVERMVEEQIRRLWENKTTTDEATERVTEIFDTTQPTDSTTGTPPLLSRTTEKREARQTSESRGQTEVSSAENEAQAQTTDAKLSRENASDSEIDNRIENETKSKEDKRNGNKIIWIVFSLILLVRLVALVGIFFKKRLNKH